MSNATVSRLGQASGAGDANALFLKVYAGEVLAMFDRENQMLGMTTVRTINKGHSAKFPVTGSIASSYHTIGNEILGTAVQHAEKVINIDDMLLAHAFIGEIDELKNEYEVRSIYSKEMGFALARTVDKHLINLVVHGSQASATISGVTQGGKDLIDADADTSATSLIDSIFECIQVLDEKDIPTSDRFIVCKPDQYYQLCNVDKLTSRDFSRKPSDFGAGTVVSIGGVPVIKSNSAVDAFTTQVAVTGENNTYAHDGQNHVAVIFHKSGVGTVKLKDMVIESTYDPRRLGTLMTARLALGSAYLRPEACAAIKTA